MATTIKFAYTDGENAELYGEWTGDPADALERAVDYLGAERHGDEYRYREGQTGLWSTDKASLVILGAALLAQDEDPSIVDVYSLWCSHNPAKELEADEYVWLPDWNADEDFNESEACALAESWLTEHEGDAISIRVRMPRAGEASGIYSVNADQTLQILGYTVPVPEEVRELTDRAWEHVLQTLEPEPA